MRTVVEATAGALGAALVLATFSSLVRTLVVPRGLSSRLTSAVNRLTRAAAGAVAGRVDRYETKDRLLAWEGPSALLLLLLTWLLLLLLGFGMLLWAVTDLSLAGALRESGASLTTLGFTSTGTTAATVVDLLAGASGLIVVALQIAYLPTLYGSFNRREVLVATLEARAGAPAWGPEILARHQLVGLVGNLPAFYAEWERWAADVAESHSNYPVLTTFRSPKALRSWVVALLSVMDSAALYLALAPKAAPTEARLCLRMSFTCLRDLADVLDIPFDPDPLPDAELRLTYEEFLTGVERLRNVPGGAFPMERTPEEAWPHFRGWRVNYEAVAYALADVTNAVPGPWSGERRRMPGRFIAPVAPPNRTPENPTGRR